MRTAVQTHIEMLILGGVQGLSGVPEYVWVGNVRLNMPNVRPRFYHSICNSNFEDVRQRFKFLVYFLVELLVSGL